MSLRQGLSESEAGREASTKHVMDAAHSACIAIRRVEPRRTGSRSAAARSTGKRRPILDRRMSPGIPDLSMVEPADPRQFRRARPRKSRLALSLGLCGLSFIAMAALWLVL